MTDALARLLVSASLLARRESLFVFCGNTPTALGERRPAPDLNFGPAALKEK
ncbi:MAG: hypothetical protein WB819_02895 [Terriglobia bacterium]|jgi:hypothetical protein